MTQTISSWWGYGLFLAGTAAIGALRMRFSLRNRGVTVKAEHGGWLDVLLPWLVLLSAVALPGAAAGGWLRLADSPMTPWRAAAGSAVFVTALALFYRTHADLGTNFSFKVAVKTNHALVTTGVYRRVRHPMYSAFLLFGVAQVLLVPNWLAGPAALVATVLFLLFRVRREERMMLDTFGPAYESYARRTNRFWPAWK